MKKITVLLVLLCVVFAVNAQKKIEAQELLQQIKSGKDINLKNTIIRGVLDFTFLEEAKNNLSEKKQSWWNFKDSNNKIENIVEVAIVFEECVFEDDVLAYIPDEQSGYTFTASFIHPVIFKNCLFKNKAMFKYSDFEKETNFYGSVFKEDSTFKYARFNKAANFKNIIFYESATFKYAKFQRSVSFENATFKDYATFKYTKFLDGVSFKNARFEEDLNIKYTVINGDYDVTDMKVAYEIDDKYTKVNGKSLSKSVLEQN